MYTMNLLILVAIVFAYFFLGGGVYMAICILDKDPWDDTEAVYIILLWPIVLVFMMPYILVKVIKKLWIHLIAAVLKGEWKNE